MTTDDEIKRPISEFFFAAAAVFLFAFGIGATAARFIGGKTDPVPIFILAVLCAISSVLLHISWLIETEPVDDLKGRTVAFTLGTLERLSRVLQGRDKAAERIIIAQTSRREGF